jgi:beta-galactosidase
LKDKTTPFCGTNYTSAELLSMEKSMAWSKNKKHSQNRYRLMWMDVKYEPGTVKS